MLVSTKLRELRSMPQAFLSQLKWPNWGVPDMFGTPKVWLIGAGVICFALFLGAVQIRYMSTMNAIGSAREAKGGAEVTVKQVTTTLVVAAKAAEEERKAEAEIPLTAERKALIALCNRSASCIDRGKYK